MGRTASKPERIGSIIARLEINGQKLVAEPPFSPCSLCGSEAQSKTSIVVEGEWRHATCQEKVRSRLFHPMFVFQDILNIVQVMAYEQVFFSSLKHELPQYVDSSTPENLCRLITFCMDRLQNDSTIKVDRKQHMMNLLQSIRDTYLPVNH